MYNNPLIKSKVIQLKHNSEEIQSISMLDATFKLVKTSVAAMRRDVGMNFPQVLEVGEYE